MDDDNTITVNYQAALVNALRPISDGLAAFHTVRQRRNNVSHLIHSPLACTHCGHDPVSVRSATSRTSSGRVHRLKRTCPTCYFVEELDLGAPPAVSKQTKKEKKGKKQGTKETNDNGNDNGNTAKSNSAQQQIPTGSHVLPVTSHSSSMKRTSKKLSELQLLLARHRQKKEEQTKKQSGDGNSGLSAFLKSL